MKKVLLTALAALTIGTAAFAQKIDNSNDRRHQSFGDLTNPFSHKSLNKGGDMISDWYSNMDFATKSPVGPNLKTYVSFLVHDSLNKYVADDGKITYGWWSSVGQILDPKDDVIQLTDLPQNQLSRFNSYKCDSIAFRYLYVRNVDSIPNGSGGKMKVVDTLFLAYFAGAQIRKLQITSNGDKLGMVDWDLVKRLPKNYVSMQTILLASGDNGECDTTRALNIAGFENSWTHKIAQFPAPAGMAITASGNGSTVNNLTGFTFTFKSGVPAIVGTDTAIFIYSKDPLTLPATARRTNYFGCRFASNEGTAPWDNKTFFNTSLVGIRSVAYATVNSWSGYISGNAFVNDIFMDTYMHLTVTGSIGAGVEEANNVSINRIYPNPASSMASVAFGVKNNSTVKINVYNLIGQSVKSMDFGKVNAGTYEFPIEVSSLKPGVYMVSVTAGTSTQTQKLVVSE